MEYTAPWNKGLANLDSFKEKIKEWRYLECFCKLWKTYLPNLGYLQGRILLASCYFVFYST